MIPYSITAGAHASLVTSPLVRPRCVSALRWGDLIEFPADFLAGCRCSMAGACFYARPADVHAADYPLLNVTNATGAALCAFREAVKTTARTLTRVHKGIVVWRTMGASQYVHGTWKNGDCAFDRPVKVPIHPGLSAEFNDIVRQEVEPYLSRAKTHASKGPIHVLLDVEKLSDLRPDAKPSGRLPAPKDCTHYCLPGVPDLWNVLMLNQLCSEHCTK